MHGNTGSHRGLTPRFTKREDQLIRKLSAEGLSAALIGKEIGRTRNSVIGRSHRIGVRLGKPSQEMPRPAKSKTKLPPELKKLKLKRPPVFKVEVLPPEPPPLVPQVDPVNIMGLKDGPIVQCRAIVADQPERLYCAATTKPGLSWCPAHAERFFNPQASRR